MLWDAGARRADEACTSGHLHQESLGGRFSRIAFKMLAFGVRRERGCGRAVLRVPQSRGIDGDQCRPVHGRFHYDQNSTGCTLFRDTGLAALPVAYIWIAAVASKWLRMW